MVATRGAGAGERAACGANGAGPRRGYGEGEKAANQIGVAASWQMGARYTKEQHNKRQSWGCGSRAIDAGPSRRHKAAGPLPQGRQWPSRGREKTGHGKELVAGRDLGRV